MMSKKTDPQTAEAQGPKWVQISGRQLTAGGQAVQLRGIGLGNWMLVEHFMIGLPQVDYVMRQAFQEVLGSERATAFWDAYMRSYITEWDIEAIAGMGFNHVRLPFSYRHFERDDAPGKYREEGFALVDRVVNWCRRHGLWVVLDLHSAPGCQASDWNAESGFGEVQLWDDEHFQARTANLWREIARRYRDEPTVLAYEILNEPVTAIPEQVSRLNAFHHRCIAAIREVDQRHVIVVNGDKHATVLSALDDATFADPQVMAAFHFYYHYCADMHGIPAFPCVHNGKRIDEEFLAKHSGLDKRADGERIARPAFLDEFGFGYSSPRVGVDRAVHEAIIKWCESVNVHWNLWHWKDVKGMGLLHMRPGTPWLKLLEKIGAGAMRSAADGAVRNYLGEVDKLLTLESKRRFRLQQETSRDLQMQMLWTLVERMSDLTASDLAALGASFASDQFEFDEPMATFLRDFMNRPAPIVAATGPSAG